ncbi:hypothetical protein ACFSBF_16495 [Sphingobacterium suaedae]|uniref:DUF5045 domain-containing protein n=2 Tax=Sphingobacterium suaedae TaxID=1686402 RepID=A0ABW5KJU8_9SPHI
MRFFLFISLTVLLTIFQDARAQNVKRQTDKHVVHQQERMVHKQWNRKKFTPTKGFLGLNYHYWLTWAWHPQYPKTDRRPLSGTGPQTLRMGLVLAMQQTDQAYRKHADTIRHVATSEGINLMGISGIADPLWMLYYRREFSGLLDSAETDILKGTSAGVQDYLKRKGLYSWYVEEREQLKERLSSARTTLLDRGSRILSYHHMLTQYRALQSNWEAKMSYAAKYLSLIKRYKNQEVTSDGLHKDRSDIEIAESILRKAH